MQKQQYNHCKGVQESVSIVNFVFLHALSWNMRLAFVLHSKTVLRFEAYFELNMGFFSKITPKTTPKNQIIACERAWRILSGNSVIVVHIFVWGQFCLWFDCINPMARLRSALFWIKIERKMKFIIFFSSTGALPAAQQTTFSLNVSAKEFVPSIASCQLSSKAVGGGSSDTEELGSADGGGGGPEARQCARCCKTYYVDHQGEALSVEKCLYHWGKVRYGSVQSGETDR